MCGSPAPSRVRQRRRGSRIMAGVRPFRFMIGSRDPVDVRTLADRTRWAEGIGCSHVCVHDHLTAQHAPIPLLTAVAMATERLRLCPLVLNNDLRHPAVLAQELAGGQERR